MASCKSQERKKKAIRSMNCMFLGGMMICEIVFVNEAVQLGEGVNELSFWWL